MRPWSIFLCVLLLAGLLAGDIATTVWSTSLGLVELNPMIAPIAGDALAQVRYKVPFIAVLLAGVLVMSYGCERVWPGSWRGPWAGVLVMFAVPPVWNLMQIYLRLSGS